MGEVWKADDPRLQRTAAIKALTCQTRDTAGRTLAEARAASMRDNPHLCAVHEVGEGGSADGCLARRLVFMAVNAAGGCDSNETSRALERYNAVG